MIFKCVSIKISFFEENCYCQLDNEENKTGIHDYNPLNRTNLFACWRKPCLPFWMTSLVYCCLYRWNLIVSYLFTFVLMSWVECISSVNNSWSLSCSFNSLKREQVCNSDKDVLCYNYACLKKLSISVDSHHWRSIWTFFSNCYNVTNICSKCK